MKADTQMRLVLVEWVDSFGCSAAWESLSECQPKVMLCRSVGWLLYDGEECKTLVPHVTQYHDAADQQGCGDMTIPTVSIVRLVDLAEGGP